MQKQVNENKKNLKEKNDELSLLQKKLEEENELIENEKKKYDTYKDKLQKIKLDSNGKIQESDLA